MITEVVNSKVEDKITLTLNGVMYNTTIVEGEVGLWNTIRLPQVDLQKLDT